MSPRAAPLSPAQRRAQIIAATLPLLRRYGKDVTTAQIALAAGVAEGTLFRAFPDKEALIAAALHTAFDTGPTERELAAIDRDHGLRAKLIAAVDILQRRVEQIWQLMAILNIQVSIAARPPLPPGGMSEERVVAAMIALIAGHEAELCCAPAHLVRLLRMFTFAGTHPRISDGQPLTSSEIVAAILDGALARPEEPDEPEEAPMPARGAPC